MALRFIVIFSGNCKRQYKGKGTVQFQSESDVSTDSFSSLAVADGKEKEINNKERFAMKYVEAASSLTPKDRLNYASEDTTYNTVVSVADLLLN